MKTFARVILFSFYFWALAFSSQNDFKSVRPGREFSFPRDHGAHPEFKTEWWYYSGHLNSDDGERFGYQLTFFRVGLKRPGSPAPSAWAARNVYFAHLALTAPGLRSFLFKEKVGRGAMGLAGAETDCLKVWIDDWQAEALGEEHHLRAGDEEAALELVLCPLKPPVLHGEGGYSRKAEKGAAASYYYSVTRLLSRGRVTLKGRSFMVSGESWLDREFSTGQMPSHLVGWDWFALQLSDGAEIMLYLLRRQDGGLDAASSGTWVDSQGHAHHLRLADFEVQAQGAWKSPHSAASYPAAWEITIPATGYHLRLTPTYHDQELRTGGAARLIYWEGQVAIQGKKGSESVSGRGYVELTGYAGSLGGRF